MSLSDHKLRSRVRLALRAERAFGLNSLPVRTTDSADSPATGNEAAASATPAVNPSPAPASTDLFGTPARKPLSQPLRIVAASFDTPVLPRDQKIARLREMDQNEVSGCTRCRLSEHRTHTVFGEGDPDASLFFIGEGPGENEDLQGRPFVGRAGDLLNKWITVMGLKREQVFIANIVKCRPPDNREPAPDEIDTCTPYLQRQLEIIRPRVIITLGRPASQHLLQTKNSMGKMRGQWHQWRGIRLMPTYHPAYVLRNYTYEARAAVWSDLQEVMKELGLPIPRRGDGSQS